MVRALPGGMDSEGPPSAHIVSPVARGACDRCRFLELRISALREQVRVLEAENARLREKLGETSHDSSKPPSHDPTSLPRHSSGTGRRGRKGRKRGAQPGHRGTHRALVDNPDRVHPCMPSRCESCGSTSLTPTNDEPTRHQVVEIPPPRPVVDEYQLFRARCDCCGTVSRAGLPPGVSAGAFGPQLIATIAYFTGTLRLPRRSVARPMKDPFGVTL